RSRVRVRISCPRSAWERRTAPLRGASLPASGQSFLPRPMNARAAERPRRAFPRRAWERGLTPPRPLMIETRDLTKKYGDLYALDRLTLKLEQGDVFGFIGPNGAGKTTTMRILA